MKAKDAMDAAANSSRKMGADVVKAGDDTSGAMEKIGKSVLDATGKFTGLGSSMSGMATLASGAAAVVTLAGGTIANIFKDIDQQADIMLVKLKLIQNAAAQSGAVASGPATQAWINQLDSVGGRKVDTTEAAQIYAGVAGQMRGRLGEDQKRVATETGLLGMAAGMDQATAGEMATNYAQLAHERELGGLKGQTDAQLQDSALQITTSKAGGLSPREMQFLSRSKNKGQALQMILGAAQGDIPGRGLAAIQNATDEDFDPSEIEKLQRESHRRDFSDEGRRKLRLAAIPQGDRAAAILNDPTLVGPKERLSVEQLKVGMGRISPHSLEGMVGATPRTAATDARDADILHKRALAREGEADLKYQNENALRSAEFAQDHPWLNKVPGLNWLAKHDPFHQEEMLTEIKTLNSVQRTRAGTILETLHPGQN